RATRTPRASSGSAASTTVPSRGEAHQGGIEQAPQRPGDRVVAELAGQLGGGPGAAQHHAVHPVGGSRKPEVLQHGRSLAWRRPGQQRQLSVPGATVSGSADTRRVSCPTWTGRPSRTQYS